MKRKIPDSLTYVRFILTSFSVFWGRSLFRIVCVYWCHIVISAILAWAKEILHATIETMQEKKMSNESVLKKDEGCTWCAQCVVSRWNMVFTFWSEKFAEKELYKLVNHLTAFFVLSVSMKRSQKDKRMHPLLSSFSSIYYFMYFLSFFRE